MDIQSNHSKAQKQHITFSTNYLKEAVWADGLRDFFEYRDLGVAGATSGKVKAHILRVREGGDPSELHTTGLHVHKLDFQMIYILKGWIKFTYEIPDKNGKLRKEEHTFCPGDCCVQPPEIVHNELKCSDDLELLEITSPAKYKTAAI